MILFFNPRKSDTPYIIQPGNTCTITTYQLFCSPQESWGGGSPQESGGGGSPQESWGGVVHSNHGEG